MSHPPVSVIVTASGSPADFSACLDWLRPELGPQDEVVCVVPHDRPQLRRELTGQSWLRILDDDSADQAGRWSAGLAATRHPIAVLLDGDVLGSARWLDRVVQPFADPQVVAAGPRCHRSYGPQGASLPDHALASPASFREYAREWRDEHREEPTAVDRLGPVCVAVRRAALDQVGGPTADLPYEQLRAAGRLVVVHSALVAHVGTGRCALRSGVPGPRPLVSASMIVKNEEDMLADCLTALRGFVDEIVVYDTGSTDRTVDIAREHGARVVEGYWNDHFAEARNRSIAHCRGEWIFVVDADEIVTGDPASMRSALDQVTGPAAEVLVQCVEGHGLEGRGVLSIRLFRADGRYYGRLHEQVVDRVTGEPLTGSLLPGVELAHFGYTELRFAVKDKVARNLHLAELAVEDEDGSHDAVANLARSLVFAGRLEEAVAVCQRERAQARGSARQTFLEVLVQAAAGLRRFDLAEEALAELRTIDGAALSAQELDARLRYTQGDYAAALALVEAFPRTAPTGQAVQVLSRGQLVRVEIMSLHKLGRHEDAARLLCECIERGEFPFGMAEMTALLVAAGRPATTIAAVVPHRSVRELLLVAAQVPGAAFDDLLEVLWSRYPGDPAVLAFAARVGAHLPLIRSLDWAARLRQHGFADSCTLVALSGAAQRTPRERALAAAIALEMFGDDRAMPPLERALAEISDEEAPGLLDEMRQLAPGIAAAIEPAGV
ncbi:MAG: glycosyltransferase [Actinobacteria bacterium]|nr:MAG: glycosyltransferase [Actinomycetota bacterium]